MDVSCNFERALQNLREGKKIREKKYGPETYLQMQDGTIVMCTNIQGYCYAKAYISSDDILSGEWFVF